MTDDERFDGFGNAVYHARANSTATPYGFVGKKGYQTDASGLLLLGHRYYDPAIGRFLSRDPIHDGDNWYAYCDNNPLDRIDPTGLTSKGDDKKIDPQQRENLVNELDELEKSGQGNSSRAKEIKQTLKGDDKFRGARGSRASKDVKTKPSSEKAAKPSAAERKMARKAELREEQKQAIEETLRNNERLAVIEDVVEIDAAVVVIGAAVK